MRRRRAANPMRAAYDTQKSHAKTRGIAFLLSFAEFQGIWLESGHWPDRGRGKRRYVMARFGDVGPYEVSNVRVCTSEENRAEFASHITNEYRQRLSKAQIGRTHSAKSRAKMSLAQFKRHQERPHSAETRLKISAAKSNLSQDVRRRLSDAAKARPPASDETRKKISEALRGRIVSEESRRKSSETNKATWARKRGG